MLNENLNHDLLRINVEDIDNRMNIQTTINDWEKVMLVGGKGKFIKPIDVKMKIEKIANEVMVNGNVETELAIQCSKCLKDISFKINENFEALYIIDNSKNNLRKTEHLDSLENVIFSESNYIDLSERIVETIVLSSPDKPLCDKNCKGICQMCGENLNKNPNHKCEDEFIDPRFEQLLKIIKEDK